MRSFLYDNTARSCLLVAGLIDGVAGLIISVTVRVFTFLKLSYANLCMFLLGVIDKKRLKEEQEEAERVKSMLELTLMQAAVRIKENAMQHETWTPEHEDALNLIGHRLMEECNWEAASVHQYFRPLVESMPGFDYEE